MRSYVRMAVLAVARVITRHALCAVTLPFTYTCRYHIQGLRAFYVSSRSMLTHTHTHTHTHPYSSWLVLPDAVDVFTENDTPVGPEALQVAFEGILKGVNAPGPNDVGVGALTALERPEWAAARDMLISVGPTTNKAALDTIDSAILLVALDHHRPADMLERGKSVLHGVDTTRSNRWWDKHQLIVDSVGNASLQFEHSFSDGASWNRWLGEVWMAMHGEDEHMSKWPYGDLPPADAACTAVEVSPITFELDSTLDDEIRRADTYLKESLGDALSTDVLYFGGFGKGAIKSWSLSPDATVQMAFQLAYVGGCVV